MSNDDDDEHEPIRLLHLTVEEIMRPIDDGHDSPFHPRDAQHPTGFVIDDVHRTIDVWWGGYEYWIELHRIKTPEKCLGWLEQLTGKSWRGMTPERINAFIKTLAKIQGWQIYGI